MKRGEPLKADPARAAERRARRETRRAGEVARPEDLAREARRVAREKPASSRVAHDAEQATGWHRHFASQQCVQCMAVPVSLRVRRERGLDLATIDGHHIIPKQDLKRWGLFARLWDWRNGIPLCRYHHARHEMAVQRVARELLPAASFAFADEINARFVLEDDDVYPVAA